MDFVFLIGIAVGAIASLTAELFIIIILLMISIYYGGR